MILSYLVNILKSKDLRLYNLPNSELNITSEYCYKYTHTAFHDIDCLETKTHLYKTADYNKDKYYLVTMRT